LSAESRTAAAAGRGLPSLILPADVVHELRLALVKDLRSTAEDLATAAGRVQSDHANGGLAPARDRLRPLDDLLCDQRELHTAIGLPGELLAEVRLAKPDDLDLAVKLLVEHRGEQAARLNGPGELTDEERDETTDSVRLLTDFLKQTIPGWPGAT